MISELTSELKTVPTTLKAKGEAALPDLHLPEMHLPDVHLPEIRLPRRTRRRSSRRVAVMAAATTAPVAAAAGMLLAWLFDRERGQQRRQRLAEQASALVRKPLSRGMNDRMNEAQQAQQELHRAS